jgi:hypothetical protein
MGIAWTQQITGPRAWRGAELGTEGHWLLSVTAAEQAEIGRALQHAEGCGVPMLHWTRREFPLDAMAARLTAIAREIRDGSGFTILRGLDISAWSEEQVGMVFWGLGLYLGNPLGQNPQGDLLGHVFDQGRSYGNIDVRGYETNAHLPFHSDACDLLGLMCLRKGIAGGLSSLVSSSTVHNEILAQHPEHLGLLYNGFQYIRREEALTGKGVSEHRIPVFGHKDGVVSSRYIRNQINAGAVKLGMPLTAMETEALDFLDAQTRRPDLRLDFMLEPGDIEFANNYTTLHSRTEFTNGPELAQQRHMLRLWLKFEAGWPTEKPFTPHQGYVLTERGRVLTEI